ncbi:hypothetical protein AgCh_008738 [Apium graveolens]
MAMKSSNVILSIGLILFLLGNITHAMNITVSPTPQPEPFTNIPMNGTTPGSLLPQGKAHNVVRGALRDAQTQHTKSHACSSAKSVAQSACACHQEHMETRKSALAMIIGRQRGEVLNALSYVLVPH